MTSRVRVLVDDSDQSRRSRLWKVINEFQPKSAVYVLRHGAWILAISAAFTGIKTQMFFNQCFKLGRKGMHFSYAPTAVIPSMTTILVHRHLVAEEILAEKHSCVGCTEFTCATYHVICTGLWSSLMAGVSSMMMASFKKTMYVPSIEKYPLESLKLLWTQYRKFRHLALIYILGNFACGLFITNLESRQYNDVKARLLTRLELRQVDRIEIHRGGSNDEDFYI